MTNKSISELQALSIIAGEYSSTCGALSVLFNIRGLIHNKYDLDEPIDPAKLSLVFSTLSFVFGLIALEASLTQARQSSSPEEAL